VSERNVLNNEGQPLVTLYNALCMATAVYFTA